MDKISGMMDKGELPTEPEDVISEKKTVSLDSGVQDGGKTSGKAEKVEAAEGDDDFFDLGEEDEE